jgi:hypothetical protein
MSGCVTECPICSAGFLTFLPPQVGPERPDKPDRVECVGDPPHVFAVLAVDQTAGEHPCYVLGEELT